MEKAKILMVDDVADNCRQAYDLFHQEIISGYEIDFDSVNDLATAVERIRNQQFDVIILDLKGPERSNAGLDMGEAVLAELKKICFTPVIFYTAYSGSLISHQSDLIKIVSKNDTLRELHLEIGRVLSSKISSIKRKLDKYIQDSLRTYLWDFVHAEWPSLSQITDGVSLDYLLARRLAYSLSKEKIMNLIGSRPIDNDKAHSMEFYVYPPINEDISTGSILKRDEKIFIVLNPACDIILRNGVRAAKDIILVEGTSLKDTQEYKNYKLSRNNGTIKELTKLLENNANDNRDRFFLLPRTSFIENTLIDFRKIMIIQENDLTNYPKIADLDSPFAESVLSRFAKYYSRIGVPDLNSEELLIDINKVIDAETSS